MEKTQFQVELNWVLDVLTSCVTLEQISVSNNLYTRLMSKWGKTLTCHRIETISTLFHKIKRLQTYKIKKNHSQNNGSVDFFEKK